MSWSKIRGHERWIDAFRRVWRQGRLAHAYLFVGPAGIGKQLFAEELAKALLCEQRSSAVLEACDQCEACRLVEAETHPDFFCLSRPWIDPETKEEKNELPIRLMRDLCSGFTLKSARGQGKVAIIADADDFNEASANCFLKTLEEPPPRSVFILVAVNLHSLPATIRSRCQVIRFAPLAGNVVRDILSKLEGVDAQLLPRLVRLAAGSPGAVVDLREPALWQFRNRLLAALARPPIDSVGWARECTEFAEDAGKEAVAQRRRVGQVLRLLLHAWSDCLALAVGAALSAPAEDIALVEPLARRLRPDQIVQVLRRCLDAEMHLDRYLQVSLVIEALFDALGPLLEN
ncbi:MAG: DNA polymerase III subunit delta' [Gemmataceae bacterium]|nr:DNA polymerase III subunit delta' [Gemmataceae bacterium]